MALSHILLAALLFAFLCKSRADLVDDVCSKTTNRQLCTNTLRADPKSRGADLRGLGLIIVNKAISAAVATQKIAESLKNGPNSDKAAACATLCRDAYIFLNTCPDFLKLPQSNYVFALRNAVSRALTDFQTCDAKYGGAEPGNLKASNQQAKDFANILFVIGNSLLG